MTTARVIDTRRLSILAHEYERDLLQCFRDLLALPSIQRVKQEAERAPYEEIRFDSAGNLQARIGSGKHIVVTSAWTPAAAAGAVYAGKLINELGLYDDFTLWVAISLNDSPQGPGWLRSLKDNGIHPDCLLAAEPTNLCIHMREAAVEGFLSESHPLVQAAIATYEGLFELPPIVCQSPAQTTPTGVPAIGFGASEESASTRHLLHAAQFYAAFPTMFAETMKQR